MLPPTPNPPPRTPAPAWAVILLWTLTLALLGGTGVLVRAQWTPLLIDVASTSRPARALVSSGPAFDPTASAALVQIAQAFSTSVAPTPTPLPPTPTYTYPTAIPPVICGAAWLRIGEVCQMPPAPLPSPTPLADCPAAPKLECIWRGSLGTPVVPTPAINVGAPLGAS